MRITIAAISSQYIHMPLTPFVLKKALEENCSGVETAICDVTINDTVEHITEELLCNGPDAVCLALYIWNREITCRAARRIKAAFPEIRVIIGGPEATYSAESVFRESCCDYVILGAGEKPLPDLINEIAAGNHEPHIPGVALPGKIPSEIAEPPAPRDDIYDETWRSMLNGRMAYVETTRGCPFSCAFCLSGKKSTVEVMEQEKALALLIHLGNSGCSTVKIIDRTFNCIHSRTKFLLRGLIEAKTEGKIGNVCYHVEVGADLFDDEEMEILRLAPVGLIQMEAGLQSFHKETLGRCSRHTDMELLQKRIRQIVSFGNIHLHIDLIAGLPEENLSSFRDSFNRAYLLHPGQLQLGTLKLIHGSRLREEDWGQRFDPAPPYEILSTPWLSFQELTMLHRCADAVEKLHNSGRFRETLELMLQTGIAPFDLFRLLGEKLGTMGKMSQDSLFRMMLLCAESLGIPETAAKDALRIDKLASDSSPHMPEILKQEQKDFEQAKAAAKQWKKTHPDEESVRFCFLESRNVAAAACWHEKNPVTLRGDVMLLQ